MTVKTCPFTKDDIRYCSNKCGVFNEHSGSCSLTYLETIADRLNEINLTIGVKR